MKVIVTCGPSYEPLDEVRRITNFSTGRMGTLLSQELAAEGFETICLRGVLATESRMPDGVAVQLFTTNDDLSEQLQQMAKRDRVIAVFHAAALCDFRVKMIEDSSGTHLSGGKINSRLGSLSIRLEAAAKVLGMMRGWFPRSLIVGWKYELEGGSSEAVAKGRMQIRECRTDGCIVNGRAYGDGFGWIDASGGVLRLPNTQELSAELVRRLRTASEAWS